MTIQEIKSYMKSKGITQIELAEKSGVPLQTIRYIFAGYTQNPRVDTMQAIEKALGLSDLTKEEREAGAVDSAKVTLTPDEFAMLETFRAIGEKYGKDKQALAMKILETMTE